MIVVTFDSFVNLVNVLFVFFCFKPVLFVLSSDEKSCVLRSSTTTLSFDASSPRNPRKYPHIPYISRNYTVSQTKS